MSAGSNRFPPIGSYGFLRLALPLAPDVSLAVGMPLISGLAAIGIVYGSLCAYAQDDIKKMVAYSSVSHLGLCMLAMFALNGTGLSGSIMVMINHGLSTGLLFLLVGMLYERYHTRKMSDYGGMASRLPLLAASTTMARVTVPAWLVSMTSVIWRPDNRANMPSMRLWPRVLPTPPGCMAASKGRMVPSRPAPAFWK